MCQNQRNVSESKECVRIKGMCQNQRNVPESKKCARIKEMCQNQRNGSESKRWVRIKEMCQNQRNVSESKKCVRIISLPTFIGQGHVEEQILDRGQDGAPLDVELSGPSEPLQLLLGHVDHHVHLLLGNLSLILVDVVHQRDDHRLRLLAGRQLDIGPGKSKK